MVIAAMSTKKAYHKSADDEEMSTSEDESTEKFGDASLGNPGWADSIANVLSTNKPKTKKSLVLSKAKNLAKVKKEDKPTYNFEIEGEIKEEKPDKETIDEDLDTKKKKNQLLSLRATPTISDRERERALKKIATKGVVQLFNAVRTQQKDIEDRLKQEKLDHRKDAVLNNINKRKFLDALMTGDRAKSEFIDNDVKKEEVKEEGVNGEPQWSALRDDFMTDKKYKNWDQDDSDADENNLNDSGSSDSE